MGTFANIVCKTVGAAGMGAVIYDAYSVGKATSSRTAQKVAADHYLDVYTSKRTLSTESPVNNAIQTKVADMRSNNPIIPIAGKVKGFISGTLSSLADNILPVSFAALAITTKGFFSKLGACGVAACGLMMVLKEGFGVGKQNPMN